MAAGDARPVPRYGIAFRAYFALRYIDGKLDAGWVNPSGFLSLDGNSWANSTNAPAEIDNPKRGAGYIDLTSSEMTCSGLVLMLQNTHPSSMPLMLAFYPEQPGDYRVDVVQVSGQPVELYDSVASNVIQVSGDYVSIEDFRATSIDTASIADAVWDETLSDHQTFGTSGFALNIASGNLISGDWSTHSAADVDTELTSNHGAGDWTSGGSSGDIAQTVWEYGTRELTGITDANTVQVSGQYVSIEDFQGAASLTAGQVADAVWDEALGDHINAGSTGDALNNASGNLISGDWGDATAANQTTIINYVDTMEADIETYGDSNWTTADVSSIGASGDIAQAVWEYNTRNITDPVSVSGIPNVNVIQVSGVYVSIEDFASAVSMSGGSTAQEIWEYAGTRALTTQDWSTHSASDVWSVATRQLTSFPSGAFAEAVWTQYAPRDVSSVSASGATPQQIWEYASRTLTGIPDVNVTQISGVDVSWSNSLDTNVTQVSGIHVSIEDFRATSVDTASIADAVWNETLSDHQTIGGAGYALNIASGTTINGIVDANIVQVSGVYVSLSDFGGVATVSGVVQANLVYISGIPVGIDSSSVADSDELSVLGNLLINRARIIRLLP